MINSMMFHIESFNIFFLFGCCGILLVELIFLAMVATLLFFHTYLALKNMTTCTLKALF